MEGRGGGSVDRLGMYWTPEFGMVHVCTHSVYIPCSLSVTVLSNPSMDWINHMLLMRMITLIMRP